MGVHAASCNMITISFPEYIGEGLADHPPISSSEFKEK